MGAVLGSVFLRRVWGGCGSGCAVRPCGGLVVWIVAASLPLMVVVLGLVSVSPDYSGRAVVLSVVWVCGLIWRVSCLGASVLPLVVPSVAAGRVRCGSDCLSCGWSGCVLRAGRVLVGGSAASGVGRWCPFRIASAAVSFVGVCSGCASCGRVWSGCGAWVSGVVLYCTRRKIIYFAPVFKL